MIYMIVNTKRAIFGYLFTLPYSYDGESIVVKYIYYICAWILFLIFIAAASWFIIWIAIWLYKIVLALAFLCATAQEKAIDVVRGRREE